MFAAAKVVQIERKTKFIMFFILHFAHLFVPLSKTL